MKSCIPREHGYYFATLVFWHQKPIRRQRVMLEIRKNGRGHTRAFVPWYNCSFDLADFEDYSRRIKDPGAK